MHIENKPSKGRKKTLIVLGAILLAILLCLLAVFGYFYGKLDVRTAEELTPREAVPTEVPITPETLPETAEEEVLQLQTEIEDNLAPPVAEQGVYNLLLLGTDARTDSYKTRTDTMMVVSVNKEEKTIAISSFLRDIYLLIPDWGYQRLNVANTVGGPAMLIDTIEQNFGIPIDNYAIVNFYSFMDVIDILGGVDVEMSEAESYYVNFWVNDPDLQVDNARRTQLEYREDGQYHLDGIQALAYCRLRNIGADPGRTERQRNMMSLLWEKSSEMNIATLTQLADAVLPHITTDISPATCLSLLSSVIAYRDFELISQQIPADGTFEYAHAGDMSILAINFEANRSILQQIIYGKQPETAEAP